MVVTLSCHGVASLRQRQENCSESRIIWILPITSSSYTGETLRQSTHDLRRFTFQNDNNPWLASGQVSECPWGAQPKLRLVVSRGSVERSKDVSSLTHSIQSDLERILVQYDTSIHPQSLLKNTRDAFWILHYTPFLNCLFSPPIATLCLHSWGGYLSRKKQPEAIWGQIPALCVRIYQINLLLSSFYTFPQYLNLSTELLYQTHLSDVRLK